MSLINQMLKELDARRSDVPGSDPYGQQVRAVPERRRIHPAWFAAAGASLLLVLVVAWLLLRPAPAPTQVPMQAQTPSSPPPQLPLKLDIDLTASAPAVEARPALSVPDNAPADPPAQKSIPRDIPLAAISPSQSAPASTGRPSAPALREKEGKASGEAAVPTVFQVVPAPKALASRPPKESAPGVRPTISKQVKEPTPQQRAENEYRKALQVMQESRVAEAISGLESALQLDVNHAGARYALISALLDSKRLDEAIARAREGLSLDPAQPGLSMILARLQLEKGELRSAIETLERTSPYAADRADYQAFLAALMQRDERHKQAIEHYFAALQKAPQNGVWWMGIGISLQAERRAQEAIEAFKRAKASNSLSQELVAFVDARLAQLQR